MAGCGRKGVCSCTWTLRLCGKVSSIAAALWGFAFVAGWQGGYDSIDLSDNALKKLDNFPDMPDLKTLLLSNNLCVASVVD